MSEEEDERLARELQNSSEDGDNDEILARDLQLALQLQAQEEQNHQVAQKRRSKRNHHHHSKHRADNDPSTGFASRQALQQPGHMLFVICELEGRPVEMLIDTGASSSVISLWMVHQLGLTRYLNQEVQGEAAGVGSSKIVGIIENMACKMDAVEFRLYFLVLDGNDPWLILGLDQMRRFQCTIDLAQNQLIFGGRDGVEVPFLDQELACEAAAKKILLSSLAQQQQQQQQQHQQARNPAAKPLFGFWK